MYYVTLESRHKVVYAYQFLLLNHFKIKGDEIVNFPFFTMHSLNISINKCKGKMNIFPLHWLIIKLVYEVARTKQPQRTLDSERKALDSRRIQRNKARKEKAIKVNAIGREVRKGIQGNHEAIKVEEITYLLFEIRRI